MVDDDWQIQARTPRPIVLFAQQGHFLACQVLSLRKIGSHNTYADFFHEPLRSYHSERAAASRVTMVGMF